VLLQRTEQASQRHRRRRGLLWLRLRLLMRLLMRLLRRSGETCSKQLQLVFALLLEQQRAEHQVLILQECSAA
jgi:hypothetical protein